ncbi:hypothetical protein N7517_001831 [Penicillium concentricum]|uniref:Uncharacterized protein n=1 Tax=Penicillium concentricum TaxID=293559 RepID=A0A9W9VL51_9EURO|nr:uncharacterized protein N7517_001831 [Penicillium concentricum]KAJ5383920.1 hypothetical protein N7517_001831 [Penicillium concentricum]
MLTISSFVFFVLLAAMAAYWRQDLFELVGSVVVVSAVLVAGACSLSSGPRAWFLCLLQTVAKLAVEPKIEIVYAEADEASAKENARLRAQVVDLEQQLRGTEARARVSEVARETDKKRHDKEVRHLDSQLATVSRGVKETLRAKDQALGECRHWRRKFEDLEDLQQQAQENPVRGIQGRARWAPAKEYGVVKRECGRPARELTAIAQVAIVNAAWKSKMVSCESKLASFESEARDYVARTTGQIGSLHAAATALSEENAYLKKQIQAKPDISHELAQQRLEDAVQRTMVFADQQHEERVNSLKQTYLKELMAAKVDYEGKLKKATAEIEAKETALAQQREAAESATQEINSLKGQLAANEAQMGELREANAKIAGDLRVTKEENAKLDQQLEQGTAEVVRLVQESDGHERAGKRLREKYTRLKSTNNTLVEEKVRLEGEVEWREVALCEAAESGEKAYQEVHKLKHQVQRLEDDNQILADHNEEIFCHSIREDLNHQQTQARVSNLENQVANYQTAEAAEITQAVQGFGMSAD